MFNKKRTATNRNEYKARHKEHMFEIVASILRVPPGTETEKPETREPSGVPGARIIVPLDI